MKDKSEYVAKIIPNEANFKHCIKQGKINGTLMADIERVMEEYVKDQLGAILASPTGEKSASWIPIEKRLPKKGENVLIKRARPFHLRLITAFQRDGIFYSNEGRGIMEKVTHWMSLSAFR